MGKVMKTRYLIAGCLFFSVFSFNAFAAKECPAVNCDCDAIAEPQWKAVCVTREAKVIDDCVANQGRPKSFCGVHGPNATPLALSLKADKSAPSTNEPVDVIQKLIAAQAWSLDESFNVLKNRAGAQQYGDAIQVANLLERDTERLYSQHRQVEKTYRQSGQEKEAREFLNSAAQATADRARALSDYSQKIWQESDSADSDRDRKAQRALAFKLARLSGVVFEYSADLYALAPVAAKSAETWQSAAELSKLLESWEQGTEAKSQHLAFYRAQAASRWHRATYHWLQSGRQDAADTALRLANNVDPNSATQIADAQHTDHESSDGVMAIKRGSR